MDALKIGIVFDDSLDKPDGVQQYILALGSWLNEQGHEVHYLVGETTRKDLPRVHSLSRNVTVRFNGNKLSMPLPTSKTNIRSLLSQEAFDVLHVQVPYSPFLAARIVKAASPTVAIVGTFHILPNSRVAALANKVLAFWLHANLRRFNAFVSVSSAAQKFAKQVYGIDSNVLSNVIDYDRFHNAAPNSAYRIGRPTILFLGRLVPRKGCKVLLEAVNILVHEKDFTNLQVLVGGKGQLMPELVSYVKEKRLEHIVTFLGYVDEDAKPSLYASADISVFPSSGGESFGIVLLEAMASGRAAILAGNNPGYASVLAAQPALLFDPLDTKELATKLQKLLEQNNTRTAYAVWGAAYTQNFDVSLVGTKLLELYKQALRMRRNVQ